MADLRPLHIIGVGCGGSFAAMHVATREPPVTNELHLWDGDSVEIGNMRSQTYLPHHIGELKVDALSEQIELWKGPPTIRHPQYIDGPADLAGIVLVAVDTMSARRILWEQCIKGGEHIDLMIELRLETVGSLIHVLDPKNARHQKKWEEYWYPDDDASTAGLSCGTATSRGPIADLTAALCIWQLVRAIEGGVLDNQIRLSMTPLTIETYRW